MIGMRTISRYTVLALATAGLSACSAGDVTAPLGADLALASGSGGVAEIRVRCELRQGRRSKISVDGKNLIPAGGMFGARVRSGANEAVAASRAAVGDEVEFDFDSNADDIAAGATAIAANFIQIVAGPDVIGEITDAAGSVVASGSAECRVR